MLEKRRLGSSDLQVTAVGLGCIGFSHAYGAPTEKSEAVRMIRRAFDMGYDFFDTAECYTGTNADGSTSFNEELVGEALRDVRDRVVIATKFGVRHSETGLLMDSRPEVIRSAVDGSLRRRGGPYRPLLSASHRPKGRAGGGGQCYGGTDPGGQNPHLGHL